MHAYSSTSRKYRASGLLSKRGTTFVAIGTLLAASAIAIKLKTAQAERAHPPLGKFIDVNDVRLHYIERGQHGQTIVLLHGNGAMAEDFSISGLLSEAAQHYHVIAFDRPGFGYSERPRGTVWSAQAQADLLHRALVQLGVKQPVIVGHSWGALVALAMASKYPAYVRSLVLLSGYYYPSLRAEVPLLSMPALPVIGDLIRYTLSPWLSRLLWPALVRKVFRPSFIPERFSNFPMWLALRPSQLRASAAETALMIPSAIALRRHYRQLTLPVFIVAGSGDQIVDSHFQSQHLHDQLKQSDLHMVPGSGHMIHYAAPQQVMEAIDAAVHVTELADSNEPTVAIRRNAADVTAQTERH